MTLRDVSQASRRQFLRQATWLVPALGALRLGARPSADEPFDSLPASVWKNARDNGLVMIHRPAPVDLSWQTQIVNSRGGCYGLRLQYRRRGVLRRKSRGISAADLWLDEDGRHGTI